MTLTLERPEPLVLDPSDITRREFIVGGVAGGILLAACGNNGTSDDAGAGPAAGPLPTREVVDMAGRRVVIPVNPQRIVALDPNRVIVELAALGLLPVGGTTNGSNPGSGFAPTLGAAGQRIASVGVTGEANLEQVAALRPDLIFFATVYDELDVSVLSAIAPTITYPAAPAGILSPVRWLGELLDRRSEAAAVEARLNELVNKARARIDLGGRTVALVNIGNYDPGQIVTVTGADTAIGELTTRLGGKVLESVAGTPVVKNGLDLSLENLPSGLAPADFLIAAVYGGEGNKVYADERIETPLWKAIPAVQRGDVAYVDVQESYGNYGVDGLGIAIDALARQLAS